MLGSAPTSALFFVTFERTKTLLADALNASDARAAETGGGHGWSPRAVFGKDSAAEEVSVNAVAATAGELAASTVRVPFEALKKRRQAGATAALRAAPPLSQVFWGLPSCALGSDQKRTHAHLWGLRKCSQLCLDRSFDSSQLSESWLELYSELFLRLFGCVCLKK